MTFIALLAGIATASCNIANRIFDGLNSNVEKIFHEYLWNWEFSAINTTFDQSWDFFPNQDILGWCIMQRLSHECNKWQNEFFIPSSSWNAIFTNVTRNYFIVAIRSHIFLHNLKRLMCQFKSLLQMNWIPYTLAYTLDTNLHVLRLNFSCGWKTNKL